MSEAPIIITDASGRKLSLRKLDVVGQVRILRAVGPEQSKNEPYVNIANAAAMIGDIDGVPLPFPRNEAGIDLIISKLGDEGMAAISAYMKKEIQAVMEAAEAAVAEGETSGPLVASA